MSNPLAASALEIWLIQDAITATFRVHDFYNCTLVSKAWNRIFTPSLWKVVECAASRKVPQDQFLLDQNSTLHQPKFHHLVRELTILSDGLLPLYHPPPQSSSASPLLQIKRRQSQVDEPDPALPNLQVLRWFPTVIRAKYGQHLTRELNLLQFLEIHQTSLHSLFLELRNMEEVIFDRLCSILEKMTSLRRVTVTGTWIQTSKQAQRFIWACRHLDSSFLPQGIHSTGRIDSYYGKRGFGWLTPSRIDSYYGNRGGGMDTNAAIQLCTYFGVDDQEQEDVFPEEQPVWSPNFEPTQIRSLSLVHGVEHKFWIYVPVFKMCPFLERLEIEVQEVEKMVPLLRERLHSSCPLLKFLKIVREVPVKQADQVPLNWSLGLLCPAIDTVGGEGRASAMETFKPVSPFSWRTEPATSSILDGTTSAATVTTASPLTKLASSNNHQNCSGFRLTSFHLEGKNGRNRVAPAQFPRPWHHLLDHHGQTLTDLDVSAITMPFREFVRLASAGDQMPHLLSLRAAMVWTAEDWNSLSVAIFKERQERRSDCQQSWRDTPPVRTQDVLEHAGFRPWTACRGLLKLNLKIDDVYSSYPGQRELESNNGDVYTRVCALLPEYMAHQIGQSSLLEKITIRADTMSWYPVLTLPVPGTARVVDDVMDFLKWSKDERDTYICGNCGEGGRGHLDQLSNLRFLKEMTWLQHENVVLTLQDAEWILDHWPRLCLLDVRHMGCYGADRVGFDLLAKRRPAMMENSQNWFSAAPDEK